MQAAQLHNQAKSESQLKILKALRVKVINKSHDAGNTCKVLTHSRSAVSALEAEARSLLGLQGVHLATLTASDAKIQEISSCTKSCSWAGLRIRDVGCSKLLGQLT